MDTDGKPEESGVLNRATETQRGEIYRAGWRGTKAGARFQGTDARQIIINRTAPLTPPWDEWMLYVGGTRPVYEDLAWGTAGYVYQRVFESSTPDPYTWYYESSLLYFNGNYSGGSTSPQYFFIGDYDSGFQPDRNMILPEPSTMTLLGLGALGLLIRRRRA